MSGTSPTAGVARIDEQLRRFQSAMLLCFAAALGVFALMVTTARHELAPLSIAFWIVAVLLMFPVAYFRAQRRRS